MDAQPEFERLRRSDLRRYARLLDERGERGGLRLDVSRAFILGAARAGRYLSYGELAEASGVDWVRARRPMNGHLWDLVVWGDVHGFPMLSSIVVNKAHRGTGAMHPETLKGFVAAAERLGRYDGTGPERFLRAQQQALFLHVQSRPDDH